MFNQEAKSPFCWIYTSFNLRGDALAFSSLAKSFFNFHLFEVVEKTRFSKIQKKLRHESCMNRVSYNTYCKA